VTATIGQTPSSSDAPKNAAPSHPGPTGPGSDLDERYGRTVRHKRRTRRFAYIAAGGFAVVLGAWLFWGGVIDGLDTIDAQNTGHTVLSEREVEVTWQLTATPGQATRCAVQALNESFAIVGWKIVDVPASTERTQSITETVRTTEQSVTGLIYRCWLP
jgi:hypothetical protein